MPKATNPTVKRRQQKANLLPQPPPTSSPRTPSSNSGEKLSAAKHKNKLACYKRECSTRRCPKANAKLSSYSILILASFYTHEQKLRKPHFLCSGYASSSSSRSLSNLKGLNMAYVGVYIQKCKAHAYEYVYYYSMGYEEKYSKGII